MSIPKVFVLAVAFLALGCSDGGGTAATGPGGGFDIDEESLFGSGGLTLSGTVTFTTAASGSAAQVGLIQGSNVPGLAWSGNEIYGARIADTSSLRFRITNLDADEYRVFARIDANGNSAFASGDLGGYHAGTTASPVQDPASATAVQLDQDLDLAFGAAAIP